MGSFSAIALCSFITCHLAGCSVTCFVLVCVSCLVNLRCQHDYTLVEMSYIHNPVVSLQGRDGGLKQPFSHEKF